MDPEEKKYSDYFKAIDINPDKKMNRSRYNWLRKCGRAYRELRNSSKYSIDFYSTPGEFSFSDDTQISVLNKIYETYPATLLLKIRSRKFLIVGDPSSESLSSIPEESLKCDYLIIPVPMISRSKYYMNGLKEILSKTDPEEIVICVDSEKYSEPREEIIEEIIDSCIHYKTRRTDKENVSFQLYK